MSESKMPASTGTARARRALPHGLALYFGATYGLAWACWIAAAALVRGDRVPGLALPLQTLGSFAPAVVALTLAAREAPGGARGLLRHFGRWRVPPGWYAAALVGPTLAMLAGVGLHVALGGRAPAFPAAERLPLVAVNFVAVLLIGGPLGEEPGWRGYALPCLRRWLAPLPAGLALGAAWGVWHLPLFALPGSPQAQLPVALYLAQTLAVSVLFAWLYERTGGSLLLVTLFHTAINTWPSALRVLPDQAGSVRPFALVTLLAWLLVALVAAREALARRSIPPGSSDAGEGGIGL